MTAGTHGQLGILNVGAGDTKLSFDKSNPAECIRSARIVTDMLRRGYALLIAVPDGKGGTTHVRAHAFREDVCEYIIADYAPETAQPLTEDDDAQDPAAAEGAPATEGAAGAGQGAPANRRRRAPVMRAIPAASASGVAVARIAGG